MEMRWLGYSRSKQRGPVTIMYSARKVCCRWLRAKKNQADQRKARVCEELTDREFCGE